MVPYRPIDRLFREDAFIESVCGGLQSSALLRDDLRERGRLNLNDRVVGDSGIAHSLEAALTRTVRKRPYGYGTM